MIAALFVQTNGVYYGLPNVDPWDEKRDARLYDGPDPVVAHPPCARWSRLANVNKAKYGTPIGEDAGCFRSALAQVRRVGGVLEHPKQSIAWKVFQLGRPELGRWSPVVDGYGGWTTEVYQSAYGHRAQKRTWLYYSGKYQPFDLDWTEHTSEYTIAGDDKRKKNLPKKERHLTPTLFRDVLIKLAEHACRGMT